MSGLDLRSRESALKGGSRGPAIIPGNGKESILFQAVLRTGTLKMPPGKIALPAEDVAAIREWIDAGAEWTAGVVTKAPKANWWSLIPPRRPAVPQVADAEWASNPVDAFIYSKLKEKGLKPAPLASPQVLVRRAYTDITGLPPTPEQVTTFLSDHSPDAYTKLIDKLLASPQYGERSARMWLDVARYADSSGFESDIYFPNAWRYRDYVIRSFNSNKPYDQFLQEQIAADELWPDDLTNEGSYIISDKKKLNFERLLGTGLYAVGPYDPTSKLNEEQFRYERLTDWVDTTSSAFLGLTVGCARCHDHKFDPITQKDYYRLAAVFAGTEVVDTPAVDSMEMKNWLKTWPKRLALQEQRNVINRLHDEVRKRELKKLEDSLPPAVIAASKIKSDARTPEQQKLADQYKSAVAALTKDRILAAYTPEEKSKRDRLLSTFVDAALTEPQPPGFATVLGHTELIPAVHVAARGDFHNKGDMVLPGLPAVLSTGDEIREAENVTIVPQRRKALARWLTRKDHPLTARVMVNRLWAGHFGRGIVSTNSDFGRQGDAPTHPELLDWLAVEFMDRGWDMKAMHRMMLLSRTYCSGDAPDDANSKIDADNRYLWRMNRRRLEAEAIRDSILSAAGNLNSKMFGPAVIPPLTQEEIAALEDAAQWPATSNTSETFRRSIYLYSKRTFRIPMLETFDQPESTLSCSRREATNVAPQALALLNSSFAMDEAKVMAASLWKSRRDGYDRLIEQAWLRALARTPDALERKQSLDMLSGIRDTSAADPPPQLARFCLMLFNLNEFLYID